MLDILRSRATLIVLKKTRLQNALDLGFEGGPRYAERLDEERENAALGPGCPGRSRKWAPLLGRPRWRQSWKPGVLGSDFANAAMYRCFLALLGWACYF